MARFPQGDAPSAVNGSADPHRRGSPDARPTAVSRASACPTSDFRPHEHAANVEAATKCLAGSTYRALASTFVMRKFVIGTPAVMGCWVVTAVNPCFLKNGRAVMLTSAERPRIP